MNATIADRIFHAILHDPSPLKYIFAPRRSGKTYAIKKALDEYPNTVAIVPTYHIKKHIYNNHPRCHVAMSNIRFSGISAPRVIFDEFAHSLDPIADSYLYDADTVSVVATPGIGPVSPLHNVLLSSPKIIHIDDAESTPSQKDWDE